MLRFTAAGCRLEADPRHAEAATRDFRLAGAKSSKLPGSNEKKRKQKEVGAPTSGIVTRADELSPIAVAAVCLCVCVLASLLRSPQCLQPPGASQTRVNSPNQPTRSTLGVKAVKETYLDDK